MRIILLLVILGGLVLLLVQNWSPVLPLVFLGVATPALPLAVWILISLAAGASTSLAIAFLLQLTNYVSQPKSSNQRQAQAPPKTPPYNASSAPPKTPPPQERDRAVDDWQESANEDWDFEENVDDQESPPQDNVQDSRSYEARSEPKSSYQTGSVYSYSYREPSDSGVGRTESVYDADYRVLTPPYREPEKAQEQEQEEEDWGFDEDEFEDEDENKPSKGR